MSASEAVEQLHALMEQVRILNAQVDAHTNLLRGNETMSLTMQELQVGVQNLQQAARHIGGQIQPQEYEFIINPKDVKVNDFHGDPQERARLCRGHSRHAQLDRRQPQDRGGLGVDRVTGDLDGREARR